MDVYPVLSEMRKFQQDNRETEAFSVGLGLYEGYRAVLNERGFLPHPIGHVQLEEEDTDYLFFRGVPLVVDESLGAMEFRAKRLS